MGIGFAIIVFIIFSLIIGSENVVNKQYRQDMNSFFASQDIWIQKVTDRDIEIRLHQVPLLQKIQDGEEALIEIFGNNEQAERFKKAYRDTYGNSYYDRIYMAKRGKLLESDARHGIHAAIKERRDLTVEEERQYCDDIRTFIFWIDKQLRKNGIHETLYVGNEHYLGGLCPAKDARADLAVFYKWEPSILQGYRFPSEEALMYEFKKKQEMQRKRH